MSDPAADLIGALENRDSNLFAKIARELQASESERNRTIKSLLLLISLDFPERARLAVDALRYSGLALDVISREGLMRKAECMYPGEVLSKLGADELAREKDTKGKQPYTVKLLKSLLMVLVRIGGSRQRAFVDAAQNAFQGTSLGARIPCWREFDESTGEAE